MSPVVEDAAMSTVVMHAVVSVDGFIAGENDEVGPLFDWYFNGTQPIVDEPLEQRHAPFRVSSASLAYVRPFWDSIEGHHPGAAPVRPDQRLGGPATRR